jgi:hypothetical protein
MQRKDLPTRWQLQLEHYTDLKYGSEYKYRGELSAGDFKCGSMVQIQLGDGSQCLFHDAFFIKAPELKEVAIFTEHCGYHIFSLYDTNIQQYERKWDETDEDVCE